MLANQEGEQQKAFHMKVKQVGVTSGNGKFTSDDGLYDDQIDKVVDRFKDYRESIMRDQVK